MHRLALAVLCAACAGEPGTSDHAVYGGSPDDGDPAVVVVWASVTKQLCTGTVIAPRVVLTAGHCADNRPDKVLFGSGRDPFVTINVIEAEAHPSFELYPLYDDYGLLLLEQEAPATPLPIHRGWIDDSMVGRPVRIVGYGDTGTEVGFKHEAMVSLDGYDARVLVFANEETRIGPGDSGGPQLMIIDGEEVVVGVARSEDYGNTYGSRVDRVASWIDTWILDRESPWQGAFGEFCVADSECVSGVCIEDALYCSQSCTTNYDCPAGIPCRDLLGQRVCAYAESSPEPETVACEANGRSGVCVDTSECTGEHVSVPGYCPGPVNIQCCVPQAAPPPTDTPISTTELPPLVPEAAMPNEDLTGGCSIGRRGAPRGAAMLAVLAVLAFAVSRRRGRRE